MSEDHNWILSADISSTGKKRLRVFEENSYSKKRTQSVDSQALEQIFNSCAAGAVRDIEHVLSSLEQEQKERKTPIIRAKSNNNNNDDDDAASKILLRYAVLADAFRRERQSNDILSESLETALKTIESTKQELALVRAERDSLKKNLTTMMTTTTATSSSFSPNSNFQQTLRHRDL